MAVGRRKLLVIVISNIGHAGYQAFPYSVRKSVQYRRIGGIGTQYADAEVACVRDVKSVIPTWRERNEDRFSGVNVHESNVMRLRWGRHRDKTEFDFLNECRIYWSVNDSMGDARAERTSQSRKDVDPEGMHMEVRVVKGGGWNMALFIFVTGSPRHSHPVRRHLNETHRYMALLRKAGGSTDQRSLRQRRARESKSLFSTRLKIADRSSFGSPENGGAMIEDCDPATTENAIREDTKDYNGNIQEIAQISRRFNCSRDQDVAREEESLRYPCSAQKSARKDKGRDIMHTNIALLPRFKIKQVPAGKHDSCYRQETPGIFGRRVES
ncbi:hypothetical protein EDD18DRAFT_1426530 [Armillaria luteobubalina]|uniref:Uncharacterized protein n=1 Tax=Armillaria luteobubalina TaxID=153913 RepID=A0AA39USY2_9AGAR|nr:hypothetical protein EDD18DRAFT_1426530 [Armillaria luteobubalina]